MNSGRVEVQKLYLYPEETYAQWRQVKPVWIATEQFIRKKTWPLFSPELWPLIGNLLFGTGFFIFFNQKERQRHSNFFLSLSPFPGPGCLNRPRYGAATAIYSTKCNKKLRLASHHHFELLFYEKIKLDWTSDLVAKISSAYRSRAGILI